MREQIICQSCGMPMKTIGDFGTEMDGASNKEYCCYCYKNSEFTEPDISMEAMKENVAHMLEKKMFTSSDKAVKIVDKLFLNLKRWNEA